MFPQYFYYKLMLVRFLLYSSFEFSTIVKSFYFSALFPKEKKTRKYRDYGDVL